MIGQRKSDGWVFASRDEVAGGCMALERRSTVYVATLCALKRVVGELGRRAWKSEAVGAPSTAYVAGAGRLPNHQLASS